MSYNIKEYAQGDLNNRNHLTEDIAEVIKNNPTEQLYQSYFNHSSEIIEHWSKTKNRNGKNTVTGYKGVVEVSDIIIDIDLQHGETDLELSRERASKVLTRLQKEYGVNLIYVYPNFSGSKGFHIRIPSELFGEFEPSAELPNIVKEIAKEIAGDIVIDESVFKTTGLMRVPNTRNTKSGLFAIPLTAVDVTNLNIAAIQKKAILPGKLPRFPDTFTPVLKLVELKESIINKFNIKKADEVKNAVKPSQVQRARNSVETFNLTDMVKLSNNKSIMISDIKNKMPIFCPFCNHKKRSHATANAFVDINDRGNYYIYCSSENKTYWQERFDEKGIFTKGNNCYYKKLRMGDMFVDTQLTSYTIDPKELLSQPSEEGGDVLKCEITTDMDVTYKDVFIDISGFSSKKGLSAAIGHLDCIFLGSDAEVSALNLYTMKKNPPRKRGSRNIGLVDDIWVIADKNYNEKGLMRNTTIVPSEGGSEAFHRQIEYPDISDVERQDMLEDFYGNILKINKPEAILPFLFWGLVAPLKQRFMEFLDGFPHLFIHGTQGGGKTGTALLFSRLWGYTSKGLLSSTLNPFPMLKMMSSSTGVPLVFDEFKKSDMTDFQVDQMHRMMRRAYTNEIEKKGTASQKLIVYPITAPMCVMGEWRIKQPALRERTIISNYSTAAKQNANMQAAYEKLRNVPLESFMHTYIPFVLKKDIRVMYKNALNYVNNHFTDITIQSRPRMNMAIFYIGYIFFMDFAKENGIVPPKIDIDAALDHQLFEITGNATGAVQTSVDQLLEALSAMAEAGELLPDYDYRILEDKKLGIKGLAIPLNAIQPKFQEWVHRTKFEFEQIDDDSYKKMFKDTDYISDTSKAVKLKSQKAARCLFIDIKKAKGIVDLTGFLGLDISDEDRQKLEYDSHL